MRLVFPFSVACVVFPVASIVYALDEPPSPALSPWPSAAAWAVISDPAAREDHRVAALGLFGRLPGQAEPERALIAELLGSGVGARLQVAAVEALSRGGGPKVPQTLLIAWNGYGPEARSAALDALLSREDWTGPLLSSLEETCVPPSEVGPTHRKALLGHPNDELRGRARVVFNADDGGGARCVDSPP